MFEIEYLFFQWPCKWCDFMIFFGAKYNLLTMYETGRFTNFIHGRFFCTPFKGFHFMSLLSIVCYKSNLKINSHLL